MKKILLLVALATAACAQPTNKTKEVNTKQQEVFTVEDGREADLVFPQGNFTDGYDELFADYFDDLVLDDDWTGTPQMTVIDAADVPGSDDLLVLTDSLNNAIRIFKLPVTQIGTMEEVLIGSGVAGGPGGGLSPTELYIPRGTAFDKVNKVLWVSDWLNERIVGFAVDNNSAIGFTNGMAATYVIGQPDLYTDGVPTCNDPAPYASCVIARPAGIDIIYSDNDGPILMVTTPQYARVAGYKLSDVYTGPLPAHPSLLIGQVRYGARAFYQRCGTTSTVGDANIPTPCGLRSPTDVNYDPVAERLYVTDPHRRAFVWYNIGKADPLSFDDNLLVDGVQPLDGILGQPDFLTRITWGLPPGTPYDSATNSSGATRRYVGRQDFLVHVSADHTNGRFYMADPGNCRVLVYDTPTPDNTIDPIQSLGWDSLDVPGNQFSNSFRPNCAADSDGTNTYLTSAGKFGVSDVLPYNGDLYLGDNVNARVLVYKDFEVPVVGGTGTTTINSDGDTVVDVQDDSNTGETYTVTIPQGSDTSSATVEVTNSPSGNQPSIKVSGVVLPPGETKSIDLSVGAGRKVCVKDTADAEFSTTGQCNDVGAVRIDLPDPGTCDNFCVGVEDDRGDTVCPGTTKTCPAGTHSIAVTVQADDSYATYDGLYHTVIEWLRDTDGDGSPDVEDYCPGTPSSGPVPTKSLKPNHTGDETVLLGCNASQILECKPGVNGGLHKFGLTPGVRDNWLCGQDGDTSDCPEWVTVCQDPILPACATDGDYDGDGVLDADDADETDSALASSTGLEDPATGAGDGTADCTIQ